MRATTLLSRLFSINSTRVRGFEFADDGLVCDVEPTTRVAVCGGCMKPCRKVHDRRPPREWRHLDLAGVRTALRYAPRRVECDACGVTTELVPWATPRSWFTEIFEQMTAYLAQQCNRTAVAEVMRLSWNTVGPIIERVVARVLPGDRLDGLTHIGIDELSYRKHHKYVTIVIDHLTGRVVWAREGKSADTLIEFFVELGIERANKLEVVSIDMSPAYIDAVRTMAPHVELVFDRFHVQKLAQEALDELRRAEVREAPDTAARKELKGTRWALQKRPWNLHAMERSRVSGVQRTNRRLYRGYLIKETLAAILDGRQQHVARGKLQEWISWATHSGLKPFVRVGKTIAKHIDGIVAYVATGISNGRSEGTNGKVRTITRRAYGFHTADSLIAMLHLCCSGIRLRPPVVVPSFHQT